MSVPVDKKKAEAVERMKKLGVIPEIINNFKDDNLVSVCEPPLGGYYWVNEEEQQMVKEFESKHNGLVYLIVRSFTDLGKMDSLFYVSDYEDEWMYDHDDMEYNTQIVYVVNHDYPDCSEAGSIGYKVVNGSVIRTA